MQYITILAGTTYPLVLGEDILAMNTSKIYLQCDTVGVGAINILLPKITIPAGGSIKNWFLEIFINDIGNNASGNNIKITPAPSDTINGSTSQIILSTDGATGRIVITGKTAWDFSVGNSSSAGGAKLWNEYSGNPIYNPYPIVLQEDYFPYVIFDDEKFNGNGDAFKYKMWHQGDNSGIATIAISHSDDGINWTLKGLTNLPNSYHACVLYDKDKFGGSFAYKIWYWTGAATTDMSCMKYAESNDGITWANLQTLTQDVVFKLVDGITPGLFYHNYGCGFLKYNPSPTNILGNPFTFKYTMFYDISSEGFGAGSNQESIGLAYSNDGLSWFRYNNPNATGYDTPVLIPSGGGTTPITGLLFDWDGTHEFRPSLVIDSKIYHLFYSGSNVNFNNGLPYAHGIGHATSRDGVTWTEDYDTPAGNPVFYYNNGKAWRGGRTYTPFVLIDKETGEWKMWFTGGSDANAGQNQGIGYATLQP
jgi:hypothetical protein